MKEKHIHPKKTILFLIVFLNICFTSFGQEKSKYRISSDDIKFFVNLGPELMINTDSAKKSAPHPVMFSGGVGCDIFADRLINFQPRLNFFMNYYIWDGEDAQPAEVENRTATGLSFMLDLCVGHTWNFGKNSVQALVGPGILIRYGILSSGVKSGDLNPITGTKAKDDVKDINKWFFKDLNFLYPEIAVTYMRHINDFWNVGAEFRTYFPLGSLTHGEKFDGAIFSLAIKLQVPQLSAFKDIKALLD